MCSPSIRERFCEGTVYVIRMVYTLGSRKKCHISLLGLEAKKESRKTVPSHRIHERVDKIRYSVSN